MSGAPASGGASTAITGLMLAAGGLAFARLGWQGLRRRRVALPGQEPAAAPVPMRSPAWRLLWAASALFGVFVLGCGLLLLLSTVLPE